MFSFRVLHQDKKTKARQGVIVTPHGKIKTPAFVAVGTAATVKTLTPEEIRKSKTQLFFVNTYHLYLRPGLRVIEKFGGVHQFMNWGGPLISDSGGFQVFSLAKDKKAKLVEIKEEGVWFTSPFDGSRHFFTPEKSIQIQEKLGADIILCLDECTYYPASYAYSQKAMERTHRWATRCLEGKKTSQALFGIVQGGVYQDLREKSAKFIASLPFEGIAIGGVSVGESKKEMLDACSWTIPFLPQEKPRHLLGVGEIDDIFNIIQLGVDTFDCVMPTRLGRMGYLLTRKPGTKSKKFQIKISKSLFAEDQTPPDPNCGCYTCQNFSRGYLHHLFRCRELLAYRLATYHNLYFLNQLVAEIRKAIEEKRFLELKKSWLGSLL